MRNHNRLSPLKLPPLSDDAVIEILDFLYEIINRFESHYFDQIHRYYHQQSPQNPINNDDRDTLSDEPPF